MEGDYGDRDFPSRPTGVIRSLWLPTRSFRAVPERSARGLEACSAVLWIALSLCGAVLKLGWKAKASSKNVQVEQNVEKPLRKRIG
jgi:hypothetical protein